MNPALIDNDQMVAGLALDENYARVSAGGTSSLLADALGSVRLLTDASGGSNAAYSYSPFGEAARTGSDDVSFHFTGRENDGASGLYYYRARYYSPVLNRFISEDPVGLAGGANFYAYVNGDPISYTDPFGLWQHHLFPQANYRDYSPDARYYFDRATIETAGAHRYTAAHAEYNQATRELAENFCKQRGLDPKTMSGYDAEQLTDAILKSKDPRIKDFLDKEIGPPRQQSEKGGIPRWVLSPTGLLIYLALYSPPAYRSMRYESNL